MFCTKCGKQIPGEGIFCSECETSISGRTDSYPTESECGKEPPEQQSAFDTTMDSPRSIENLIDNASNTFNKNRHVDEPNLMQIDFNNPDTLAALQQIMGSGYYYYLPRFQQIQTYGKSSYNWYSMLLGIVHAAYRNVWRELVDKMKWVLLVVGILWILPLIVAFVSSPVAVLSAISLAYFATMAIGITQIVVASSFDKIYMRHILKKLLANDFTPDEDMGRGFKIALASTGITWIVVCIGMSSLAIL